MSIQAGNGGAAVSFPGLEQYLARICDTGRSGARVWLDAEGRAQGRYFNATLTSAFQPIRALETGSIAGYEGFARSYAENDQGLCLWRLLDQAASDDESVELDRLCRMLHSINFFRQPQAAQGDLYLSVHARLLAAVEGNHGTAFNRILRMLDLPQQRIVLQLPPIAEHQGWLLNYVADNYRRNGFRIAVNAVDVRQAQVLVERMRPEAIKIDARQPMEEGPALHLLQRCAEQNVRVIFKRVESASTRDALVRIAALGGWEIHAQGFLWDLPHVALGAEVLSAQVLRQAPEPRRAFTA